MYIKVVFSSKNGFLSKKNKEKQPLTSKYYFFNSWKEFSAHEHPSTTNSF